MMMLLFHWITGQSSVLNFQRVDIDGAQHGGLAEASAVDGGVRHGWDAEDRWVEFAGGIVPAIAYTMQWDSRYAGGRQRRNPRVPRR